ncbi:GerAB/ArcD/ProY family transporter [Pelotomaculum propionicicum]|uniref:GerAB/ArcD/ProY family transporter n=1 Tax=Pelotomaculum propionicicum TaxID=258475 RepID=UPI003B7A3980
MKTKTSRLQYFFMIPNLLYGKAIGVTSGVIVRKIGADVWTSMLFGFVAGTVVITVMAYLGSKFPDKTIVQYSEVLLGKWTGRIIGLLLTIFFAVAFGTSANTMTLHVKEYFLLETPFFIICLLYTLLCMYGVFLGIEVVLRFSLFGFLGAMLINVTMVLGTVKDFRFINLQPLLDKGIAANLANSIYIFSDIAMAIFAVAIIYPMLNKKEKTVSYTFWAMVLGCFMVVIWPFFETGVMGAEIMKQYIVVCMQQVRCAQFTKYLPRYELIMVTFFVFSMYVQSVAMFYSAKYSFKQITGIKKDWYIIVPLTVILVFITYYMANDHNNYVHFLSYPWSQFCFILSIALPLVLLIAALARGKLSTTPSS